MEVTAERARFREALEAAHGAGSTVGFVPTMGALHDGHRALLEAARRGGDVVALSIFVNPLQFAPTEDLARYPRPLDHDLEVAEEAGCDLVFTPAQAEMYPNGPPEVTVDPGPLGDRLEGASRPGHFRGVLTVVAKLFDLAGPCRAYFGEKDAQQLALIRRMVRDLDMPVEVIGCPTVRELDGLALSSRNGYLSADERRAARSLAEALTGAAVRVAQGEGDVAELRLEMADHIEAAAPGGLDYAAIVDDETWEDVEAIDRPARALVAARFGSTRLTDNRLLGRDAADAAR